MSRSSFDLSSLRAWTLGTAASACMLLSLSAQAQTPPDAATSTPAPAASRTEHGAHGPHQWHREGPRGGRPDGPGRMDPQAKGDLVEHVQQRLAHLKVDLKITAAQEKAWQAYVTQATRQAEAAKARLAKRPSPEALDKLSAPERMALRTEAMKQRVADQEAQNKAFKTLYAALTPDQQKLADSHAGHDRGPGRERGRGDDHGPRHGR